MEEIGCDAALNYKDFRGASRAKDFTRAVREACKKLAGSGGERAGKKDRVPKIDIYFDNVGGWMLDAMLLCMRNFGVVVACGVISTYNGNGLTSAPSQDTLSNYGLITSKRLTYRGFVVTDFSRRFGEALEYFMRAVGDTAGRRLAARALGQN